MKTLKVSEDAAEHARLLAEVGDELTVHIASEEEIFYPAVRAKRTEDVLLESLEEHLSLKRLLADLHRAAARCTDLRAQVPGAEGADRAPPQGRGGAPVPEGEVDARPTTNAPSSANRCWRCRCG